MKPYLIVTPGYNDFCGGIKVLHRLCHLLNKHGQEAYLTAGGTPANWNVKFLEELSSEQIDYIQHEGIVVYPDVVWGNPLRFNNCVQYDLQGMRPIQTNMLGVSLEPAFRTKNPADLTLLVIYMEDFFKLPEVDIRERICYYQGKGKTRCPNPDWENIAGIGREQLARLYKTSKLLVCADNMTQTTIEARLCGCPVQMVEESMLSWNDYRLDAWGMNGIIINDDKTFEQAKSEIPAFYKDYFMRLQKNEEELRNFIKGTQNRQVEYIPSLTGFHPGMFGISPEKMEIFNRRK